MVLILNGEVLADDDPRAVAYRQSQQSQPPQQPQHRNATVEDRQQVYMRRPNADAAAGSSSSGYERMGGPAGRFGGAGAAGGGHGPAAGAPPPPQGALPSWLQPGTPLGRINQQMVQYLQPFNLGGIVMQPIYLAIIALAMALLGVKGGIMVALVLFFVVSNAR